MTTGLRLHPPAGSPLAETRRALAEILPWFAHNALIHYLSPRGSGTIFRRRLGHPRRLPGPVELLLALGRFEPMRDLLVPRVPAAESRWRLAAVVHVLRPRAEHPPRRFPWRHRVLARVGPGPVPARPRAMRRCWRKSCRSSIPRAMTPPSRATAWAACRTGAGRHPPPGHPRNPPGGLWSWRLERFAAAGQTRHARALVQCLDRHAPLSDAHHSGRGPAASGHRPSRRRNCEAMAAQSPRGIPASPDRRRVTRRASPISTTTGTSTICLHPRDGNTGLSYSLLPMIHAIINDMLTPEQAETHLG